VGQRGVTFAASRRLHVREAPPTASHRHELRRRDHAGPVVPVYPTKLCPPAQPSPPPHPTMIRSRAPFGRRRRGNPSSADAITGCRKNCGAKDRDRAAQR
jgi:hypothetical protein